MTQGKRTMPIRFCLTAALVTLLFAQPTSAAEPAFLLSMGGKWTGKGSFRVNTKAPAVSVSCSFAARSSTATLTLDGNCRGMVLVSRTIGVRLKAEGQRYGGTYIGSRTGPAALSGRRQGDVLNLGIRWAKPVNGDRNAEMRVEKLGRDAMRIVTIDKDATTGKSVVTAQVDLKRN